MACLAARLSSPLIHTTSLPRSSKQNKARPLRVCAHAQDIQRETLKVSRRDLAKTAMLSVASATCQLPLMQAGVAMALPAKDPPTSQAEARQQLLETISSGGDSKEVQLAIDNLVPFNPTNEPARSPKLEGEWRLLWSSDVAEVTKATKDFPLPFQSIQLIGPGGGMEEGRAANLIRVFGGFITLKLSSSAVPDPANSSAVTIGPPFRLGLLVGDKYFPIQENDGAERKDILGNEFNEFSQLYFEDSGKPGDLRVSKVTNGDPIVIGSEFVHVRV
mmetsp:Transcript_16685/g.23007  ORF Transcript_16685/g.23007 Transcript_16685/m.23007 type:complete len:275 (-) Transcript_16685:90-914(-)|eukprot:CAMPEP_0196584270 /NCGR_PEP_ID=MMETSP1081-20130531/46410_1 /TAXON_ID=36882 /ORGANISM="Pyramimonas amylifera, Strain CCMP720" /LENGTH=274 /DNA_ID=CAMNT_0041905411 /DNA_START=122 /DNA_END=946 /DNA_ORIENTATION=+